MSTESNESLNAKITVTPVETVVHIETEKEKMEKLYQAMKDNGINSIGDLEVKISRL